MKTACPIKLKTIDDSAQSVIESSKAEVDGHLTLYSSQFDEKIDGVQKQLGEIVEAASKDIRSTEPLRGIKTIDETRHDQQPGLGRAYQPLANPVAGHERPLQARQL
jgi:hypothetical protein